MDGWRNALGGAGGVYGLPTLIGSGIGIGESEPRGWVGGRKRLYIGTWYVELCRSPVVRAVIGLCWEPLLWSVDSSFWRVIRCEWGYMDSCCCSELR
jgi:hypothetical protein